MGGTGKGKNKGGCPVMTKARGYVLPTWGKEEGEGRQSKSEEIWDSRMVRACR